MTGPSGPALPPTAKQPVATGSSNRRWVLLASAAAVVLVVAAILGIVLTRGDGTGAEPAPTVLANRLTPTPGGAPRTQPTRSGAAAAPTTSPRRSSTEQPAGQPTEAPAAAPAEAASTQDGGPTPDTREAPVQPVMAAGGPFVNGAAASLFRLTPAPETRIAVQAPAAGWRAIERQSGAIGEKEVWETGSVMTVKGDLSVREGATLVISPGVIVKFAPGAGLYVQGALSVPGTAENGVVFTTLADDTYGGDTDNTGDTVLPKPGDWSGVYFDDNSRDDKTAMDHVLLRYARNAITLNRAAPTLSNIGMEQNQLNGYALEAGSWGTNQWQNVGVPYVLRGDITVDDRSTLTIAPGVVVKAAGSGLYVSGALDVRGTEAQPVIMTSLADDAYGGDTDGSGDTVAPKPGDWSGVYFDDSTRDDKAVMDYALLRYARAAITLNRAAPILANIGVELNQLNGYALESGSWATSQWQNTGLPYVLKGDITIDDRSTLTIAPGVVVKAAGSALYVSGVLDAQGGDGRPVVMTSLADDAYGGDTDNSGDTVAPKPGDWNGVYFNDSSRDDKARMNIVLLRYANNAVTLNRAAPTLSNIGMEQNRLNGYALESGSWGTNQWQNVGVPYVLRGDITVDERSMLTIAPGVVVKAAGSGLYVSGALDVRGTEAQPVIMTSLADDAYGGDTDGSGDTVAPKPGDWSGVYFDDSTRNDKTIMDYAVLRFAGRAITLNRAAPTLTHIGMEQNQVNGYALESGSWATNQWQNTGLPYVLRGDITVEERSTLTIAPGVVVKAAGSGLYISGVLDARGTPEQPVVMTSLADDGYGGDTDGNGDSVSPKSGDWSGVYFYKTDNSGKSALVNVLLRYARPPGYVLADGATPGTFESVSVGP